MATNLPYISRMTRKALLLAWWVILPLFARAESPQHTADADTLTGRVERTYLFGVGHNNLYDSYLSPLNYSGTTLSFTRIGERHTQRRPHRVKGWTSAPEKATSTAARACAGLLPLRWL